VGDKSQTADPKNPPPSATTFFSDRSYIAKTGEPSNALVDIGTANLNTLFHRLQLDRQPQRDAHRRHLGILRSCGKFPPSSLSCSAPDGNRRPSL